MALSSLYDKKPAGRSWTKLVSMELTEDEKMGTIMPMEMPDRPEYPYGLRLCLTDVELGKMGLTDDCEIGDLLDLRCFARVTSISKNVGETNSSCRIELQITDIAAENEMTESMDE
jgi:hypothetical protein